MEDALKKATEEAHKQRVALTGGVDMKPKNLMQTENKALSDLKKKQEE
jgi:hypothetical protein